ncbi:hypothetical protein J1614_006690 [Plenodomus biglobosus]|nr:hypothetical protein J1614_006690 [Plenodomus biglobosus]
MRKVRQDLDGGQVAIGKGKIPTGTVPPEGIVFGQSSHCQKLRHVSTDIVMGHGNSSYEHTVDLRLDTQNTYLAQDRWPLRHSIQKAVRNEFQVLVVEPAMLLTFVKAPLVLTDCEVVVSKKVLGGLLVSERVALGPGDHVVVAMLPIALSTTWGSRAPTCSQRFLSLQFVSTTTLQYYTMRLSDSASQFSAGAAPCTARCRSTYSEPLQLEPAQPALPALQSDTQTSPGGTTEVTSAARPKLELKMQQKPPQPYGFGPAAPSQELPFPAHANLTAAELLTFLPHSIRSADIIYRLVSNGGTRRVLSTMINTQRLLLIQWSNNTCGTTMYKAMNDAGFEGWTVGIHGNWHDLKRGTWDEKNLDVAGCRRPGEIRKKQPAAPDVPFRSLAMDVRQMPRGHDALDLTRMVQYCTCKPKEIWMYPRDYSALLEHLGGPTAVTPQHHDRQVFRRWIDVEPPAANPVFAARGGQTTKKKRSILAQDQASAPETHSPPAVPASASLSMQTARASNQQSSNSVKRRGKLRKQTETRQDVDGDTDMDREMMDYGAYSRPAAKYVAPPEKEVEPPSFAIELALRVEGMADERDRFSPYAFGGPRSTSPYRSLHRISQPDRGDISGWAENLRWASEQRRCFWQSAQAGTWNESPEHMELITKIRRERTWASDELVEHVAQEQYEESRQSRLYEENE